MVTSPPNEINRAAAKSTYNPPRVMEGFFNQSLEEENDPFVEHIRLSEPWQLCTTGYNGFGKTAVLAYLGVKAMALGLPVWSNFKIGFRLVHADGKEELRESQPLDIEKLVNWSGEYHDGVILGDEWMEYQSAYAHASMQTRLLDCQWMQRRKFGIFFAYSAQWMGLVDPNLRQYTDVEIACADWKKLKLWTVGGRSIQLHFYDLSGSWTTHKCMGRILNPSEEAGFFNGKPWKWAKAGNLWFEPLRGCYDTYEVINPLEAMNKVQVAKRVIDVGGQATAELDIEGINKRLDDLFASEDTIPASEVKAELRRYGVDPLNKMHTALINQLAGEKGVRYRRRNGSPCYVAD